MRDINFKGGVHTALITPPFTKKDNLDEERLEELIEAQITSGVNGLVPPCGTTGESPTLSHDEHDQMIAMTVKFANGRVPVIAGTGSNATSEAVRLSSMLSRSGGQTQFCWSIHTTTSLPRKGCTTTSRQLQTV